MVEVAHVGVRNGSRRSNLVKSALLAAFSVCDRQSGGEQCLILPAIRLTVLWPDTFDITSGTVRAWDGLAALSESAGSVNGADEGSTVGDFNQP